MRLYSVRKNLKNLFLRILRIMWDEIHDKDNLSIQFRPMNEFKIQSEFRVSAYIYAFVFTIAIKVACLPNRISTSYFKNFEMIFRRALQFDFLEETKRGEIWSNWQRGSSIWHNFKMMAICATLLLNASHLWWPVWQHSSANIGTQFLKCHIRGQQAC